MVNENLDVDSLPTELQKLVRAQRRDGSRYDRADAARRRAREHAKSGDIADALHTQHVEPREAGRPRGKRPLDSAEYLAAIEDICSSAYLGETAEPWGDAAATRWRELADIWGSVFVGGFLARLIQGATARNVLVSDELIAWVSLLLEPPRKQALMWESRPSEKREHPAKLIARRVGEARQRIAELGTYLLPDGEVHIGQRLRVDVTASLRRFSK